MHHGGPRTPRPPLFQALITLPDFPIGEKPKPLQVDFITTEDREDRNIITAELATAITNAFRQLPHRTHAAYAAGVRSRPTPHTKTP